MRRIVVIFSSLIVATPALAATFTVDSTADAVDASPGDGLCSTGGGACTLRAAIQEANALSGADVINLPAGTYTLTIFGMHEDASLNGDLDIRRDDGLDLNGAGAHNTIIDGNKIDRVLDVGPAGCCTPTVRVNDVTIRNGRPPTFGGGLNGGGVRNQLSGLELRRVMITASTANLGSGIASTASFLLSDSTVYANNTSNLGAGIYVEGPVVATLENSTIASNSAFEGVGGLLLEDGATAQLSHTTVAGNFAPGGGGIGLLDPSCTVTLSNSILAGNSDDYCCIPSSLILVGANVYGGNPLLGPLQGNGGSTLTRALLPGSPALDIVTTPCPATDQRGVARPQGAQCDAGAFEGTSAAVNCGNGVVEFPEECDDANGNATDGCSACRITPCFGCTGAPSTCTPLGDGSSCNDSNACTTGDICTGGTCSGTPSCICGDGSVNPEEGCDDGNAISGDGCSAGFCAVEPCYNCSGSPSVCTPNDSLSCVDSNPCTANDFCSGGVCVSGPTNVCVCGNSYVQPENDEECDDGNTAGGDGCSALCEVEPCFMCSGSFQSLCTPDDGPPCDDGNACTVGETCTGGTCGNGSNVCPLDHYKCYAGTDLKNPKFTKRTVDTTDQTTTNETVNVLKVKFVCTPVDKNGEGIANPSAHLTCYQVKGADLSPRPAVQLNTQFQASRFELKKPRLVCLPSTKVIIP